MKIFNFFRSKTNKDISITKIEESYDDKDTIDKKEIVLSESEIKDFLALEVDKRLLDEEISGFNPDEYDCLLEEAAKIIVEEQQGSTSLIQRRLKLGYNRAGRIIDQLEKLDIIGPFEGSNARIINVKNINELSAFFKNGAVRNDKLAYFNDKILPLYENYIIEKVAEVEEERAKIMEQKYKEVLKASILKEEQLKKEKENFKKLKEDLRKELIEEGKIDETIDDDLIRVPIPQDVMDKVWNRDRGRCVKCDSQEKLEFDHIIPISRGGANTYRNLQVLCEKCNRQKSNNIG